MAHPPQHKEQEEILIELRDVHKSFGSKKILQGVNITIRRGEAVGIIGGSGTGKSTTLRLMAGLLAPDKVWPASKGRHEGGASTRHLPLPGIQIFELSGQAQPSERETHG